MKLFKEDENGEFIKEDGKFVATNELLKYQSMLAMIVLAVIVVSKIGFIIYDRIQFFISQ